MPKQTNAQGQPFLCTVPPLEILDVLVGRSEVKCIKFCLLELTRGEAATGFTWWPLENPAAFFAMFRGSIHVSCAKRSNVAWPSTPQVAHLNDVNKFSWLISISVLKPKHMWDLMLIDRTAGMQDWKKCLSTGTHFEKRQIQCIRHFCTCWKCIYTEKDENHLEYF